MMPSYTFCMSDILETGSEDSDDLRRLLSNNIRMHRKDLHLTQEQLAENADISLSYLADIEHCKTWISDKTLLKLAKALHTKPYELLVPKESYSEKSVKTDVQAISDIMFSEKKELIKTVSDICDKAIQEIMKVQ